MKNLTGLLFILIALFSCSKSDIESNPEKSILGKWKLKSPINENIYLGDIKEQYFEFDNTNLGIRGIRLDYKWGSAISSWDRNATIKHHYSLSEDKKILSITYESGEILDFDVLELNKSSLIISANYFNFDTLNFTKSK